ncbi:hypothetical protein LTR36_009442 [Oleoguttula mirabilis]|uniref:Cytochrome P450 n=1 Tax=Oleoguttula mirabilis TaxID=1507867 RepID=A0AAV9JSD0_9PEZI|nr:hypothetical protein LTR36_009442 [Oleoguttula mirabilis]
MDRLSDYLTSPISIVLLAVCGLAYVLHSRFSNNGALPDLPWVGKADDQLFAEARASIASFSNSRRWLNEGYTKYTKKGLSYIFPDFSGTPNVIIPREEIKWLIDHDDRGVSVSEMHHEQLEGAYIFTDPYLLERPFHEDVVHKALARKIGLLVPDVQDEMQNAMDDVFGLETEWREVCVFEAMMKVIARVSNRMFVGLPLCRNEEYLANASAFAQDIITDIALFSFIPKALKPLLAPILTIPNRKHYRGTAKHTLPLIHERLELMDRKARDPSLDWQEPNDYISWHINLARAENNVRELDPVLISRRLMPINFAAIHTTTFTITNALFDIVGSRSAADYLAGLEEEAHRVFAEEDGKWSKPGLAKLVRADSALKDSMRISGFMTRAISRKVTHRITNEKAGWSLEPGALVATDLYSVHMDSEIYPRPDEYDAFRFSRPREEFEQSQKEGKLNERSKDEVLRLKNTGLITTSETFLPFGHGRHACPGRFFVSTELKMLISHLVLNYEIEPLSERPPNKWFGPNVIPPMKQTIKVRRRKESAATNGTSH